jgi:hypothetical protein
MPGRGLFGGFKAFVEGEHKLELPDRVATMHLGHLRGRNKFKDIDVAVIAGRLEPGVEALERLATSKVRRLG